MKKIIAIFISLAVFAVCSVSAQTQTAYFMEGSTSRTQLNPAFAPTRGYVNIPVLGGIQFNTTGNLSLGSIFYPRNGSLVPLFDKNVSAHEALSGLRSKNVFATDARINLIGFGAFRGDHKSFWSFELNTRVEAETSIPYNLVEFVKTGAHQLNTGDIAVSAQSYIEAAFGYSFQLTDKIYFGARAKFLVGAGRARMSVDRLDVRLMEDVWSVDAQGSLETSGLYMTPDVRENGTEYYGFDNMNMSYKGPAGYGFAVDLGATYDVLPELQVSLAVNDLGFISWSKGTTSRGQMTKSHSFSGVDIIDGEVSEVEFDFGELEFDKVDPRSKTEMLRASINAGGEYKVWRRKIGLGLLYNCRIWDTRAFHNITASVNFTPIEWFTFTGSYSFLNNRGHGVGFALNACPNWINFFVATDILLGEHTPQFLPVHASSMNVTVGIGVPIGKRSHRSPVYDNYYE